MLYFSCGLYLNVLLGSNDVSFKRSRHHDTTSNICLKTYKPVDQFDQLCIS